jgi:hypothetical protein
MNSTINWFIFVNQVQFLATCHDPQILKKVWSDLT